MGCLWVGVRCAEGGGCYTALSYCTEVLQLCFVLRFAWYFPPVLFFYATENRETDTLTTRNARPNYSALERSPECAWGVFLWVVFHCPEGGRYSTALSYCTELLQLCLLCFCLLFPADPALFSR